MDKKESDVGYPEEQPDEVHDKTTEPDTRRRDVKDKQGNPPDDGKATGNPNT
jgi:hypothetical protein